MATLPVLPESVEEFIVLSDAVRGSQITLRRHTGTRWVKIASFAEGAKNGETALLSWVVHQARAYVDKYGPQRLQLQSDDDSILDVEWQARGSVYHEEIRIESGTPDAINTAAWQLTFKAAQMMLEACSVAPRLVSEVADLQSESMKTLRAAYKEASRATAPPPTDRKTDRLLQFAKTFAGGPTTPAASAENGPPPEDKVIAKAVARIMDAVTPDELKALRTNERFQALTKAKTKAEFRSSIIAVWDDFENKRISLSDDSLTGLDAILSDLMT